ncbi:hypothetical protein EBT31_15495 [bacterium]|nr:hypothetical protein [bacterium]
MTEMSEAGAYHKRLIGILRKHSSYPDPSLVSHAMLCAEWEVLQSNYDDTAGLVCMCGKEDIRHVNVIRNRHNEHRLEPIGSSCIRRFEIEPLALSCMCCAKELGKDNAFLQAFMKFRPISAHSLVIGHKRCARAFFRKGKAKGCYGVYLTRPFKDYMRSLGVSVALDRDLQVDVSYTDPSLTPYMDALIDAL